MEESRTEICMLRRRIAELETERQADKEKIKNSIPKAKIEEKIKELKEQRRLLGFKAYLSRKDMLNDDRAIVCQISVLEELLKDGGE